MRRAAELAEHAQGGEVVGVHSTHLEHVVRTIPNAVALGFAAPMIDNRSGRHLLLEFLPMLTAEQPAPAGRQGRPFVVRCVRVQHKGSSRRRQGVDLIVGNGAVNRRRGDVRDLVAVDETEAVVMRLDGQAVKEVEFRYLEDVLDRPELRPRGRHDRGAGLEGHVGDGSAVGHVCASSSTANGSPLASRHVCG